MKTIRLSSGYDMPTLGLGTWQTKLEDMEMVILTALESGYKLIDTAHLYGNEEVIGKALKKWFAKGGKREELFIETKLPHFGHRPGYVEKYMKLSLERLGLDYVDMYLVHMPFAFVKDENEHAPATNEDGSYVLDLTSDHLTVWKEMEEQVKSGRTRSIGLSNFTQEQILRILNNSEIKPSNLQVELHLYHQQKPLREFCKKHNIAVTGWSSLGSPSAKAPLKEAFNYNVDNLPDLIGHPLVNKIAEAHKKTSVQVILRHLVQEGVIVIPQTALPERIKANIDIYDFELTEDEIKQLNALDRGPKGRIIYLEFLKGAADHPEYPFKTELAKYKSPASS